MVSQEQTATTTAAATRAAAELVSQGLAIDAIARKNPPAETHARGSARPSSNGTTEDDGARAAKNHTAPTATSGCARRALTAMMAMTTRPARAIRAIGSVS